MDAIFLDTNAIRNTDTNSFFGNIQKYKRISELAQVYIPSIVIEEIKNQKRRTLKKALSAFCGNYFTRYLGCDTKNLDRHVDDKIEELYNGASEEIDHIELPLTQDQSHMDLLMPFAVCNQAPFDLNSDKGFKDAYIYLTILQYVQNNPKDDVFLITNDGRLREAFEESDNVEVIYEPDDYFNYREEYFSEPYFKEVLVAAINDFNFQDDLIDAGLLNISEVEITEDGDWRLIAGVKERTASYFEETKLGRVEAVTIPVIKRFEVFIDFVSREIISIEEF